MHTIGSGDPNVYAYVSGRALKATDPLGLMPTGEAAKDYEKNRHAPGHATDPGPIESAPAGPPNEMHPRAVAGSPPARAVAGATKGERWGAAKAGAQNWAIEQAQFAGEAGFSMSGGLGLLGGKALSLSLEKLRAPEPSSDPSSFREFQLRESYNFMQRGLDIESTGVGLAALPLLRAPAGGQRIALSLGEHLQSFEAATASRGHLWWRQYGSFQTTFERAAEKAGSIHFNLQGFSYESAVKNASWALSEGSVTNAEFRAVMSNPALREKTTFYKNGLVEPTKKVMNDFWTAVQSAASGF